MMRYLMLIGTIVSILVIILLMINIRNTRIKYLILIGPFVLGAMLYLGIFLLTKDMAPYECDGAALLGIFVSFILLGMGILFNITDMLHLALTNKRRKV